MTGIAERLAAALADRYRIERELGAGGMATVFLAEDLKHDRKVAIKVLKPELAAVLGAERFVVEIKTTAALSHPHILPLFDSGEAGGFLYYVMPYIEGETIRDRLNRETQLGIDEAVRITREVADALDYAHRHGVIHRDIKPENILLHDGRPMVMDFGIALAVSAAAGGRMTETGLSLGTPHYMSPEQATADRDITARSDIYSLASVLYEMLTGNPPHTGSSAQQIIMKIIAEPVQPVTALRRNVPPHMAAALATALEKLPADRFASAQEFAAALANPLYASAATSAFAAGGRDVRGRRLTLALSAALAVVSFVALWLGIRPGPDASPSARFAVALPTKTSLQTPSGSAIAVSADGSMLVFAGADSAGVQRLWVKRADEVDASPVAGTEGGFSPFLSPDGAELGFFRDNPLMLHIVALAGGRSRVLASDSVGRSGAYWATDGFIYFDADERGIDRVRPDGSGRESVAVLDSAADVAGFAWPEVLPGDRVVIARRRRRTDQPEDYEIVAIPIGGGRIVSLDKGLAARHLDGHLLIVRADGAMVARRIVDGGRQLDGASAIVASDVRVVRDALHFGAIDLATDRRGALYYVSASGREGGGRRLTWLTSGGRRLPADSAQSIDASRGGWVWPAPGSRRVMLGGLGDSTRVWIRELPSGVMLPIEVERARNLGFGWSAEGDSIFLAMHSDGGTEIRRRRVDGLGVEEVVARDTGFIGGPISVSRDHRWIVAQRQIAVQPRNTPRDQFLREIVVLDRRRDSVFRSLVPPQSNFSPVLSPDAKWLAYQSIRSGREEVYVQPFPEVNGGILQVTVDGGYFPVWSPTGERLYFLRSGPGGGDALLVVDIVSTPTLRASAPRVVFSPRELVDFGPGDGYDVAPDGGVLMFARMASSTQPQLVRVENVIGRIERSRR
jgi:hypothetical protein